MANYNNLISIAYSNEGSEPVTLAEGKAWLKMDDISADDTIITMLIKAARIQCENYCNLSFITRTVTAKVKNTLGGYILPMQPITSDVVLKDKNGNTVESMDVKLDYIQAVYDAGYETLPSDLKTAILLQLAYLYSNRGNDNMKPFNPMALNILNQYRRVLC